MTKASWCFLESSGVTSSAPSCDARYALCPTIYPAARRPPRQRLRSCREGSTNPSGLEIARSALPRSNPVRGAFATQSTTGWLLSKIVRCATCHELTDRPLIAVGALCPFLCPLARDVICRVRRSLRRTSERIDRPRRPPVVRNRTRLPAVQLSQSLIRGFRSRRLEPFEGLRGDRALTSRPWNGTGR